MHENSQRSSEQDCIDVIDKLHEMAHAGAFKNMDAGLLSKCSTVLCTLFDVSVTMDDAAKIFDVPKRKIYNIVHRYFTSKDKPKSIKVLKFSTISKFFSDKRL